MTKLHKIPDPIRIAFVSNTSWSIYNFRLGLIRRLKELGYEVLIIAPKDTLSAKLVAEGFSFQSLYLDNYGSNPLNELRTLRQLIRIYRKYDIQFIFHYTIKPNIYGSIAAKYCGIPSIAITTGLGHLFSFASPVKRKLAGLLYRFALRYSKEVWFLNKEDRETFIESSIVEEEKTFLLPGEGIDINRFKAVSSSSNSTAINFLFAGRIIWDKGLKELAVAAEAIREINPKANFQLLGFIDPSNPYAVPFEQIEEWQRQGLFKYLGETADVRPFIDNCSCLIFPSYREGISRVLLEAAAMSKPIITTDNVGCREVVENGVNGFLCKSRDSEDLINKIKTFLLLTEEERQQMGRNGRKKIIREFDEEIVIREYLQTLNKYLSRKTRSLTSSMVDKKI